MEHVFSFADTLGPSKIVHLYNPAVGLKAVVAVDNVACGPAIGGIRMAPDVSTEEAFRLARAMTLKNAAAGLPHGGGKSVIFADPKMPTGEKEQLIRAFACAIRDVTEYIPGPDMGNGIKLRRGRETAGAEVSRGNAEKKTSTLLRGSNGNWRRARC